jgi:hypothetical protein
MPSSASIGSLAFATLFALFPRSRRLTELSPSIAQLSSHPFVGRLNCRRYAREEHHARCERIVFNPLI